MFQFFNLKDRPLFWVGAIIGILLVGFVRASFG